jgi:DNA-binding FadR family transcriptional regulator
LTPAQKRWCEGFQNPRLHRYRASRASDQHRALVDAIEAGRERWATCASTHVLDTSMIRSSRAAGL